jgi:hypothetical protein
MRQEIVTTTCSSHRPHLGLGLGLALATLAALLLAVGYVDLARGGITRSAVALVVAYCGAIPAAIWLAHREPEAPPRAAAHRPPYLAATLAGACVLALYLATLAPSTAFWDASEYIAASYMLGIPHPPGNPLFVLLGRVATLLPVASSVAVRVNLLSAVSTAVACGVWFLVAHRVLSAWRPARWQRLGGAALASLLGATAFTVWNQSVVTEKVYPVALAGIALVSWLAMRWLDEPDGPRADRLLLLAAYLLGLGYANQMAGIIPAPCLAIAVLAHRPRTVLRWRLVLAGLALALVGLTPFATQPIRAAYAPAINEGEPTACRAGLAWRCTVTRETWAAFKYNFDRRQYGKPPLAERQACPPGVAVPCSLAESLPAQAGMWWQYFRWQWWRDAYGEHPAVQGALAALFLVLGLAGARVHWRHHRASWWYWTPLVALLSMGLVVYMNFKYGATQAPSLGGEVPREVRDRDYFFIWSFGTWGVWAALGLAACWSSLASLGERAGGAMGRVSAVLATALVVAVALVPLAANWRQASRRDDRTAIAFARDLLNSVEPYGVLVTGGDNDTFPLWYAQEVEGVRPDVTVFLLELLNTDWYVRGLIRRPVHVYDEARGPAAYRGLGRRAPTTPVLRMTLAEADSVPAYVSIAGPMRFRAGGIAATIDPTRLPQDGQGRGILVRSDLLFLRMLADNWATRPIYVSRTAGDVAGQLGLADHALTQGLVRRIVPGAITPTRGVLPVQGGGWLDVARTDALWSRQYEGPAALVRRGGWIDRASVSIPYGYLLTGAELADALRMHGDTARARRVTDEVRGVARAARVEGMDGWLGESP